VYAGTETQAEVCKQRRKEPPILPWPRMAKDAAEGTSLQRGQAEEPPTKKRRRIGGRAEDSSPRQAEALDKGHVQGS